MVSVRRFTPEPLMPILWKVVSSPGNRRHQGTQGNKGTPTHNTTDKPLHSALKVPLASGCRRGMQLQCNVAWNCSSLTLALPPHCEGHSYLISASQRWGDDGNPPTLPHSGHGVCYVAPPWWLPPTLPRTRIRRGVQLRGGKKEQQ